MAMGCDVDGDDEGNGNVSYYCNDSISSVKAFSEASDVSNEDSGGGRASPFWKDSVFTAPLYAGGGDDDSDNSNVPNRSRGGGIRSCGQGASGDFDHTGQIGTMADMAVSL